MITSAMYTGHPSQYSPPKYLSRAAGRTPAVAEIEMRNNFVARLAKVENDAQAMKMALGALVDRLATLPAVRAEDIALII